MDKTAFDLVKELLNSSLSTTERQRKFVEITGKTGRTYYRYRTAVILGLDRLPTKHYKNEYLKKAICYFCHTSYKLVVHHIDKDRTNNNLGNLLLLCTSCHIKLHKVINRQTAHTEEVRKFL